MTDTLTNKRGEGHIKTAMMIIIAVVIGGLLLAGVYSLFAGRNGVLKKTKEWRYKREQTMIRSREYDETGKLIRKEHE